MNIEKLVFGKLTKLTKKPFTPESQISEIGVDSLDLVELITETEAELDITITDEELVKIVTVNDIIQLLSQKVK